jgi:hypothetical protein
MISSTALKLRDQLPRRTVKTKYFKPPGDLDIPSTLVKIGTKLYQYRSYKQGRIPNPNKYHGHEEKETDDATITVHLTVATVDKRPGRFFRSPLTSNFLIRIY